MKLHRSRRDDGMITLWVMGGVLMLLFVGAITISLWSAFTVRRSYTAAADAAAQAGASALDVDAFRADGTRQLDPDRARQLAEDAIAQSDLPGYLDADVTPMATEIVVVIHGEVEPGLLGLVDEGALQITVRAVGQLG